MNDRRPTSINRKIIIGALIAAVGLALSGVILIPVLQQAQEFQESQETPQAKLIKEARQVQEVEQPQEVPPEVQSIPDGTRSASGEIQLVDIHTSPRSVRFLDIGESTVISGWGQNSDGSRGDLAGTLLTYVSSNPSVVRVTPDGMITAAQVGSTDIVVNYQGLSRSVPVTVYGNRYWFQPFDPATVGRLPDSEDPVVLNRVMVELKPGYTSNDAQAIAAGINGNVLHSFRTFQGYLIEFDIQTNPLTEVLAILERDPRVDMAYPDELVEVNSGARYYNSQRAGNDPAGFDDAAAAIVEFQPHLTPVKIAIIDDGILFPIDGLHYYDDNVVFNLRKEFDWTKFTPFNIDDELEKVFNQIRHHGPHQDASASYNGYINEANLDLIRLQTLTPNNWRSTLLRKNKPTSRFHGTAVASVVTEQIGTHTVSPDESGADITVPVIPYQLQMHFTGGPGIEEGEFLGHFDLHSKIEEPAVTAALDYIKDNMDIIDVVNMSFVDNGQDKWKRLIETMENEVTFVVSAGNDGQCIRKGCKPGEDGVVPALWSLSSANVIAVGGTDALGHGRGLWANGKSSNFGPAVSIAAPGTDVSIIDVNSSTTGKVNASGTSFAAPAVTAAVAMLKSIKPDATPSEIKERLIETADVISICTVNESPCPIPKLENWRFLRIDRAVTELIMQMAPPIAAPAPAPTPTAVPTALPTPTPTAVPTALPTPTPTAVPTALPTPTPRQQDLWMTPEEERLMADFYNCVQESLAFKLTVGTLTALGDLANPPPGAVLDDWNLFLPYYLTLFRADPEAELVIEGMIPLFCDKS